MRKYTFVCKSAPINICCDDKLIFETFFFYFYFYFYSLIIIFKLHISNNLLSIQ